MIQTVSETVIPLKEKIFIKQFNKIIFVSEYLKKDF